MMWMHSIKNSICNFVEFGLLYVPLLGSKCLNESLKRSHKAWRTQECFSDELEPNRNALTFNNTEVCTCPRDKFPPQTHHPQQNTNCATNTTLVNPPVGHGERKGTLGVCVCVYALEHEYV